MKIKKIFNQIKEALGLIGLLVEIIKSIIGIFIPNKKEAEVKKEEEKKNEH